MKDHLFLVMVRATMDDLPLRLFKSRKEALKYTDGDLTEDTDKAVKHLGYDMTSLCCIVIVEFRDGFAYNMEIIRDLI